MRRDGTLKLPPSLQTTDSRQALDHLATYYGTSGGTPYQGAGFDTWDPSGRRIEDMDRFVSDDLVAIELLSVSAGPVAAIEILIRQAADLTALLAQVPRDMDLVDAHDDILDGPASELYRSLRRIHGLGPTKVSKLLARKRPRLVPIRDSVIDKVMGVGDYWWRPLRDLLNRDSKALANRLGDIRDIAGLANQASLVRVLDVIAWMDGKQQQSVGRSPGPDDEATSADCQRPPVPAESGTERRMQPAPE